MRITGLRKYKRYGLLILFFLLLASFLRIYKISDISMYPSLIEGDYVIVENISAGVHVPSFLGYFSAHLYSRSRGIERGDMLVFKHPLDERLYIKRCVAVGGDSVMQHEKVFYLQIESSSEKTVAYAQKFGLDIALIKGEFWLKAPYEKRYAITHFDNISGPDFLFEYPKTRIERNHFFMLGDLRDNSTDSRFFHAVPYDDIYYKLWLRFERARPFESVAGIKFYEEQEPLH